MHKKQTLFLMKTLFFLLFLGISSVFAQCHEVVFTDKVELRQLNLFRDSFSQNERENTLGGVVVIHQFVNKGDKCWQLSYLTTDWRLDECPSKYSYLGGQEIVLIIDADENGTAIPKPDCQQTKECIQKVVEGWLYILPRKDRWIVQTNLDGTTTRVNLSKLKSSYDDFLTRMIRFKKDGTVVDFYPPYSKI